jgi:hypothetical protein
MLTSLTLLIFFLSAGSSGVYCSGSAYYCSDGSVGGSTAVSSYVETVDGSVDGGSGSFGGTVGGASTFASSELSGGICSVAYSLLSFDAAS